MKTAIDELMDFIEDGKFEYFSDIYDKAKELKEIEKQQIADAFENGIIGKFDPDNFSAHDAENYYKSSYENAS